jgi:hypothetical protein
MKFLLLENVLTTVNFKGATYFIYTNPKSQELKSKEDTKDNRCVIDPEGNIYMEAMWVESNKEERKGEEKALGETLEVYSEMIHDNLIEILHEQNKMLDFIPEEWWKNPKSIQYGLGVQRNGNTMNFYLAESYDDWIISPKYRQLIKDFFVACKKKNPFMSFYYKGIFGV